MRIGWAAAAAAVVLAGCASSEDVQSDRQQPARTATATASTGPAVDPATKAEATKALDAAYEEFVDDSTGRFRSEADFLDRIITAEGAWDIEGRRSLARLSTPGADSEGAVDGTFVMRSMTIDDHVYGGPEFGPAAKCWFDYGTKGIDQVQQQVTGMSMPANPYPWYQPAMMIASEARALGFVDGDKDVVAVEVFADSALSVLFNRIMLSSYATLPQEQIWVPAVLTLDEGKFSTLRISLGDALTGLEDAGMQVVSKGASADQAAMFGEALEHVTMVTTYEGFGDPVDISSPSADELMAVDDLAAAQSRGESAKLCAAAKD